MMTGGIIRDYSKVLEFMMRKNILIIALLLAVTGFNTIGTDTASANGADRITSIQHIEQCWSAPPLPEDVEVCEELTIYSAGIVLPNGNGIAQLWVNGSYEIVNIETGDIESTGKHRSINIGQFNPSTGGQRSISVGISSASGDDWKCRSNYVIRHVDGGITTEIANQKCS